MNKTVIQWSRYAALLQEVHAIRPKTIMEIGVYKAANAYRMIKVAQSHYEEPVKYFGFDLFEDATDKQLLDEVSLQPNTMAQAYERLKDLGGEVTLFKGNTRETLPMFKLMNITPDMVFIDGGHSIETIEHDWSFVKDMMDKDTIIIFDDYVLAVDHVFDWGCNRLICRLFEDVEYKVSLSGKFERHMLREGGDSQKRISGEIRLARVTQR